MMATLLATISGAVDCTPNGFENFHRIGESNTSTSRSGIARRMKTIFFKACQQITKQHPFHGNTKPIGGFAEFGFQKFAMFGRT